MSRLRIVHPPARQLTLDDVVALPQQLPTLAAEALPLARQLAILASAIGPESARVGEELVELLERPEPTRPRRVA